MSVYSSLYNQQTRATVLGQRGRLWTNIETALDESLVLSGILFSSILNSPVTLCRLVMQIYYFQHGVMRDTLSNMVSCFPMSRQQSYMTISNSQFMFYIIGTHSNNVLIWVTKQILGTVFCVHIMCVPNDYHSHLLKYGKMHSFSFLSFHSLQ